jgi:nickel/cobalt exporter
MGADLIYYLTASVLGGFHALEPGHGKTVVAAYLIGSEGRKIDAVLLGIVVTLTHTISVIVLAIAAKLASTRMTLTEESLHGYLGLVAGVLILGVGLWMLIGRIRGKDPFHFHSHPHGPGHSHGHDHVHDHNPFEVSSHTHDHSHADDHNHHASDGSHHHASHGSGSHEGLHVHPHDHEHDFAFLHNPGHTHDHRSGDAVHTHNHQELGPTDSGDREKRPGYWQLFLLGISGGLVPCPAAIAILLAAVGAGRLGEGLTYILLFSLGLAVVLIAVGLAVLGAGRLANRFLDARRFARKVSIASAAVITLLGLITVLGSMKHLMI